MHDKALDTPWQVFWCADVAGDRLLHVSPSVTPLLGLQPEALLDDPLQWNHAVLPADAARLPRPFFGEDEPHGDGHVREYRILGADLHVYQVRDRRFRWRDPLTGLLLNAGVVEGLRELHRAADEPVEPSWEQLWNEPVAAAPKPSPEPDPDSDSERGRRPAVDPASDPPPESAPHEHGNDPGVHPDGPKRYHDDHATPHRMHGAVRIDRVEEEEATA